MSELKVSVESLKQSVDSTKTKADELIHWKNKIIGGAVVLGAVISLIAFVIGKFSDYVTIKTPASSVSAQGSSLPLSMSSPPKEVAKQ